jgi:hypothetical protein
VAGAAEDIAHLVAHQFLDARAGGAEILAGIKLLRVLEKALADGGRHGQAQVGVNVDLGATDTARNFDVLLRDAGGVFAEFAAVFVDFLDKVL